ncbi:MAG: hypothetical protein KZQ66_12975, partial [Candidatus Thiodiazotropha sp. (ex Lucinoma aequizonata)]|nr:hypothetical protein [Candidatus Thiodiazotropha sp. (ex Lucinoma aequizonata)]MCU7888204.1 hypothetical protein [Candidatus Thiodiazotropha sp. (ex Lucinoma aequizonata)]MCU7894568.1 hypothetical protein [Candidatus Thiodiazotropha sp. (ex Lucinoma aequizonata)]MCU7900374.1 hypothetical protein [Candidatus Thiodiazotropha sp. (ex Lucinoma aequizonata)]MCU7902795.1 hypothetical protein [Candidatus Thiodiazotropha sp. (ex Lucinoma aequizonata)]
MSKYDISCIDTLYLAGGRCDPDTLHWAETMLKKSNYSAKKLEKVLDKVFLYFFRFQRRLPTY